ncbi:hypothetical protein MtrunA17_Chr4g0037451 [Medicago truncatula]|uniref:Uncharacterized protein n=1 Tax=Medicago truncatula TaxID=3880 RepID=A0A396I9T3_MEDTR|nr:hypothetical protein MtrunA17_Chr4g0037451 [Medicago truncatula]
MLHIVDHAKLLHDVAEKIEKIKTTLNKYPCMIRVSGSLDLGLRLFCASTNTLVFCPSFYTILVLKKVIILFTKKIYMIVPLNTE